MQSILPYDKKRELLVKNEGFTNYEWGCRPSERPIEEYIAKGVINLDKPVGPTSHEVVSWVKKIFNIRKAGHGGTLDPGVTGILPVSLEKATKVVQTLLLAGKEYICIMHLHEPVSQEDIEKICREFVGKIYQRPPFRSSVKRRLRIRRIYYLDVMEVFDQDVLFRVGCQAGTYIRKLCHDIGEVIGCSAHMSELRRTRTGSFKEDEALVTLIDVKDAYTWLIEDGDETEIRKAIGPMEKAVEHLPKIIIRDSAVDAICHGADLTAPGVLKIHSNIQKNGLVAILTLKDELVALAKTYMTSKEILELDHGRVAKTERVFMERGTYPSWRYFKK